MAEAALDDNDRLRAGTLPENPGDDAVPMRVESPARATAMRMLGTPDGKSRPLPQDIDAELALLAALLWCGRYAPETYSPATVIDLLDRLEMVFLPAHRAIWGAMVVLRSRSAPCDTTSVHSELVREKQERAAGGMEYLEQLLAAATPANELKLREYAESIREAWMRRELIVTARELATEARAAKGIASDIATTFASRLADAAGKGARDASYVHVSSPLARTIHKARHPGSDVVLTTGFPKVDELLFGGYRMKEVTVLGARTSVGKSAWALESAISAHESKPEFAVVYISLEMNEEQFTDRLVASRACVEAKKIKRGTVDVAEFDRMVDVARKIRTEEIYFNVKQSLTSPQIRGVISRVSREVVAKGKRIGLVVIDHIGLVKPSSRKASREQEVAETSRELRNIASDFDCHVLALAQISREAEKQTGKEKMPQLHHLRESGAIEQDTNNVLILHRERTKDGRGFVPDKPAKLAVAKARDAELGLVWLAVEPKFVRFSPWETSDQNKAKAPDPHRNPSRQYLDPTPDPDDESDDAEEYFNTRGM